MEKLRLLDWAEEQRRRYWRWAGRLARRDDGRWSRKLLDWSPGGLRPQGRPRKRWEDRLSQFYMAKFGCTWWLGDAKDPEKWDKLETEFVQWM